MEMPVQREMPFHRVLSPPKWAPQDAIDAFTCYRDAVIWCWKNRINTGAGEKADQALCANLIGLPTQQMSRCVSRDSYAPMNMNPDFVADFQSFCGWRAVSQFQAGRDQLTFLEQVLEERRAVA